MNKKHREKFRAWHGLTVRGKSGNSYKIIGTVAAGMHACVMKGQTEAGRTVAIKMRPVYFKNWAYQTGSFQCERDTLQRFKDNPHFPTLLDVGVAMGGWGRPTAIFDVMQFIPGRTVSCIFGEIYKGKRYSLGEIACLSLGICTAVEQLHRADIAHLDLKPENLMFASDKEYRVWRNGGIPFIILLDFAWAHRVGSKGYRRLKERVERKGKSVGSPSYYSPQRWQGQGYDQPLRLDVDSLGIMHFEMTVGDHPYIRYGDKKSTAFVQATKNPILDPTERRRELGFPAALTPCQHNMLMQAVSKEQDERFQTIAAYREALESVM